MKRIETLVNTFFSIPRALQHTSLASMGKLLKKSSGAIKTAKKPMIPRSGSKSYRKMHGGIQRPHRFRPGTVARREIRQQQKSTELLIKKAPFRRLIAEVAGNYGDDVRFAKDAKLALQDAVEAYLIERFDSAQELLDNFNRKPIETLMVRHMESLGNSVARYPDGGKNTYFQKRASMGLGNPYAESRPRKEKKKKSSKSGKSSSVETPQSTTLVDQVNAL